MSLFDFPRIHFKGTLRLNPGTANNDDYASDVSMPADWGPFAGQAFGLVDSKRVAARTFGMSDDAFIAWVQKTQEFDVDSQPGTTTEIIPAEWNYYGDMSSQIVDAEVVGVQTGPGEVYGEVDRGVPASGLLGANLTFSGSITDVNSEGSPPATQFFIETLQLAGRGSSTFISAQPFAAVGQSISKGTGQWINFFRNVSQIQDAGSGTYVYHVIQGASVDVPGFDQPGVCGIVFRYYLALPLLDNPETMDNKVLERYYEQKKNNPKTLEIIGTFAPLYENERILTVPVGRLMISKVKNVPTPNLKNNGGGSVALAPAVLDQRGKTISVDFIGTFPNKYDERTKANPKYDFGKVSLHVSGGGKTAEIGPVDYADTGGGDRRGWIFDFDVSSKSGALEILERPDASFQLVHGDLGNVLEETDYYFVSNQQAVYGEQHGSSTRFVNQGTAEPAVVSVYHRGRELDAGSCPPITLWQYRSIPLQSPGDAEAVDTEFKPGQPIEIDTRQPGNHLFTFTIADREDPPPSGYPPKSYAAFAYPPAFVVTYAPSISLRVLPNDEDFSKYYVDPGAAEPVGNALLTFDVVFDKVLRVYFLLYPVMNQVFPLDSQPAVSTPATARAILERTDPGLWMSVQYMPRTRDLSASRRTLLQAWCRKLLGGT